MHSAIDPIFDELDACHTRQLKGRMIKKKGECGSVLLLPGE